MTTTDTPRVWIGCLTAYNEGCLHGEWVDAIDADEINEAKDRVIASSPALLPEEWFIADYDGFPAAAVRELGEYANFETVADVGRALEEHGPAFAAWLSTQDALGSPDDLSQRFEESYRGEWDSEKAFAIETVCEIGWSDVPPEVLIETGPYGQTKRIEVFDELSFYLDWELIARDMFQHGEYTFVDGYVFEDVHNN
jgi:antirestriction protein